MSIFLNMLKKINIHVPYIAKAIFIRGGIVSMRSDVSFIDAHYEALAVHMLYALNIRQSDSIKIR